MPPFKSGLLKRKANAPSFKTDSNKVLTNDEVRGGGYFCGMVGHH